MYKDIAIDIIAKYIEEAVNEAKGNIISVSVKQINKRYERGTGRPLPRKIVFHIVKTLKTLHATGLLEKIGGKFVVRKGSELWKCTKEGRARECISDYVTRFTELVEVVH